MKLIKTAFSTALVLTMVLLSIPAFASGKIDWQEYEQGLSLAEKQGKKIFLYFHADWCKFCVKMKQTTFENEEVIQLLNTRFIPIRVDSEVQTDIAGDYGVKGLPNSWFLGADAGPINQLPGYVDGPVFALILNYIESDSFKTMTFREYADGIEKRSPS